MAIQVLDGFDYKGTNPNFSRDKFVSVEAMKNFPESGIDNGHICYVEETKLYYQFIASNTEDTSTGKWRLYNNVVDEIEEDARAGYIPSEKALRTEIDRATAVETNLEDMIGSAIIPQGAITFDETSLTKDTNNIVSVKGSGITSAKIADSNITTAKLADASVTHAKIADNAIEDNNIKDGEVTKAKLATAVQTMLDEGYKYIGIATPSTNPGTPDQKVFYLALQNGKYINFDNIVINKGEVVILKYNDSWIKEVIWINNTDIIDRGSDGVASLSFVDEQDNCIAQFKDGHIKMKNFDSRNPIPDALTADNIDNKDAALAFIDEEDNCIVQFKDGHIKTKNFNSRNINIKKVKSFASIGLDKLTASGSSFISEGVANLASGIANKIYLSGSFEGAHWDMFINFACVGSPSIIIGKDDSNYGAWLELKNDNGVGKYTLYNNGTGHDWSYTYDGELGFNLTAGEIYSLHLFFDVSTKKVIGFEVYGQFNEYFTYTFENVSCNGYGNPFFYTNATSAVVSKFSLSNQRFYDFKNAKVAVWGHSYVEGDSLGADRIYSFSNLLAEALGVNKVFNFGLGGDTVDRVYNKIQNEIELVKNVQYGLVCVGANDGSLTAAQIKTKIDNIAVLLINNNITPIFFTIAPINFTFNSNFVEVNVYIREHYLYVDMEQVFVDVDVISGNPIDANIKQSLYLTDHVHPTKQGHKYIFDRIKLDCPFLF